MALYYIPCLIRKQMSMLLEKPNPRIIDKSEPCLSIIMTDLFFLRGMHKVQNNHAQNKDDINSYTYAYINNFHVVLRNDLFIFIQRTIGHKTTSEASL